MTKQNRFKDEGNDRNYFTIIPRYVWALVRSPHDFILWYVIKEIAGEDGECILATGQLAELTMMSGGKVYDCRKYLIEVGLLEGELRRDPGYPQPVWHLTIPDLWRANVDWAVQHPKIFDRLVHKIEQKKSFHPMKARAELSPGEKGITPGEKGITPGEKGITPGETKKNQKKIQIDLKGEGMPKTPKQAWNFVKETIRLDMDRATYEAYLEHAVFKKYVGKVITVEVPDRNTQEWLMGRVTMVAMRQLRGVMNEPGLTIKFYVEDQDD